MSHLARATLWPLACAASTISFAIMIRDDVSDADYRALAQRPQFSMVGLVEIRFEGGGGRFGTGTFIGFGNNKAWVLTAEHVLDGYGIENSRFRVGDRAWRFGDSYSYLSDMAVIPIEGLREGDLRPARFINYTLPVSNRLEDRVVGTFVGFGKSGTGKKPDTVDDSLKRAGQQRRAPR